MLEQRRKLSKSAIVILLVVGAVGGLFIAGGFIFWQSQKKVQNFQETKGYVLSARIETCWTSTETRGRGTSRTYQPRITYQYEVEGKEYTNDQYDALNSSKSKRGWTEGIVNKYPVGQECSVYYNPIKPSQSVLTKNVNMWFPYVFVGIGLLIVIGALYVAKTMALKEKIRRNSSCSQEIHSESKQ